MIINVSICPRKRKSVIFEVGRILKWPPWPAPPGVNTETVALHSKKDFAVVIRITKQLILSQRDYPGGPNLNIWDLLKSFIQLVAEEKVSKIQSMRGISVREILHCKSGGCYEGKNLRLASKSWQRYLSCSQQESRGLSPQLQGTKFCQQPEWA